MRGRPTGAGGKTHEQDYLRIDLYVCTNCLRMINDRVIHDRWHAAYDQNAVTLPELTEDEEAARRQLLPRNVSILPPYGDRLGALDTLRERRSKMAVVSSLPGASKDNEGGHTE